MSADRECNTADDGASVRVDDQRASTTQSAGAAIFECSRLSPRECCILELIGQGFSNKRVARALGITAETVKSHVKRVFIKLEVNTRAHAVARAQFLGLFGLQFIQPRSAASESGPHDSASAGAAHRSVSEY
jgi:ATP/maltotriose-dependent transcriptional regulator MalT